MNSGSAKSRKKPQTSEDRMFQIFRDSEIYVAMKSIKGDLLGDNSASNAMFFGVLMDACSEYYYLGTGDEITAAIQKSEVAAILDKTMIDDQMFNKIADMPEGTDIQ